MEPKTITIRYPLSFFPDPKENTCIEIKYYIESLYEDPSDTFTSNLTSLKLMKTDTSTGCHETAYQDIKGIWTDQGEIYWAYTPAHNRTPIAEKSKMGSFQIQNLGMGHINYCIHSADYAQAIMMSQWIAKAALCLQTEDFPLGHKFSIYTGESTTEWIPIPDSTTIEGVLALEAA